MSNAPETILVVDDEHSVRKYVTAVLTAYGYQVYSARCGERGFDCFLEHADEIDLVFTDITMPKVNGPEMIKRILQHRPEMKVLYMTGYISSHLLQHGAGKRFGVLEKPFDSATLLAKIRECLQDGVVPHDKL